MGGVRLAPLAAAAFVLVGCGGGSMMQKMRATQAAMKEPASVEVCLDRLEDIDTGLGQVETLLFATPIEAESPWVAQLKSLDQPTANQYVQSVQKTGPYSMPQRNVPSVKVFRLHTEKVLTEAKGTPAAHASFTEALASLTGEQGKGVLTEYAALNAIQQALAAEKAKIAALEEARGAEGTTEARKAEIDAEITAAKAAISAKEAEVEPAEDKLIESVKQIETVSIGPGGLPLARTLVDVVQHAAMMTSESVVLAAIVAVHAPMAVPNLPGELQTMAQRWVTDTVKEVAGEAAAGAAQASQVQLAVGLDGISLEVQGLQGVNVDPGLIKDKLFAKVGKFYDQATAVPGRASSIGDRVSFQARFLTALGTSLAKASGTDFVEAVGFSTDPAEAAAAAAKGVMPGVPAMPSAPQAPKAPEGKKLFGL